MTLIVFTHAMARALHNTALMLGQRDDLRMCNTCIPDYMAMATEPRVAKVAQQALLAWVNVDREKKFKNLRAWCMAQETTTVEVVDTIHQLASTMDENIDVATILEAAALLHRAHGSPYLLHRFLVAAGHGTYPTRAAEILYMWMLTHRGDDPPPTYLAGHGKVTVHQGLDMWAVVPWRTAEEVIYALEACAYEITRL